MQKKFAKSSFWFSIGSSLLLVAVILAFISSSSWALCFSLTVSWCILLLSFQEENSLQKTLLTRAGELEKDIADLQNAKESVFLSSVEKEQAFKQERISFEKKLQSFQQKISELDYLIQEKESLIQEKEMFLKVNEALTKDKEQEIVALQEKLANSSKLLDDLNEKRVENFQLSLLHDSSIQQNMTNEAEIKNLKDAIDQLSEEESITDPQLERDYKQLKKQFDEKTVVLNQTRKDLFHLEGRLLAFQKEREHKETEINPAEVLLGDHLKEVEEECKGLEVEIAHLQDFISRLLAKKTPGRKKKTANAS